MPELQDILIDNDFKYSLAAEIAGTLTRTKIDAVLFAAGISVPLENQVSFTLFDTSGAPRMFLCIWFPEYGFYATKKLDIHL